MNNSLPVHAFSCFVTGTDTEIGKTLVASALVYLQAQRGHRVAAMKPVAVRVQSGAMDAGAMKMWTILQHAFLSNCLSK